MINIPVDQPWSIRTADTVMARHPLLRNKWHYEPGVALLAIQQLWLMTKQQKYLDYIKHNIDDCVQPDGTIRTYVLENYNIDQINEGKLLFLLHRSTGDTRYQKAAFLLREQMRTHPRTSEGGFWHKAAYPHQMWLDGIYMAAPFLAEFACTFDEPTLLDEVVHEFTLIDRHTRDEVTGLLYHGWDESKTQRWANPQTGCSPHFWGRAVGWYMMALVDVLDFLPPAHVGREALLGILNRTAQAVIAVQDAKSGVWYQVLDQGHRPKNYLEASASCMFVYTLAKGIRQGWLPDSYREPVRHGYAGLLRQFIEVDQRGWVNLHRICSVAGLGYKPVDPGAVSAPDNEIYRNGSFEYYVGEPITSNDYKGIGPFMLASLEVERIGAAG